MKQIKFTLPVKEVDGHPDPDQLGLSFITYYQKQIHLNPGESAVEVMRDLDCGWYGDWSDEDIKTYYETRYTNYGLEVEIVEGDNYP